MIVSNAGKPKRRIRVALDCGNAVPGPLCKALEELGGSRPCPLYLGHSFPHHPPDPTRKENMADILVMKMVLSLA